MSCTAFNKVEQPPIWDHKTTDDVYIKRLFLKDKFSVVPQHSHEYAHTTLVTKGSVKVYQNDEAGETFTAPAHILIPAKTKHYFVNLEPDTELYCIHNVMRTGKVEVHELNDPFKGST